MLRFALRFLLAVACLAAQNSGQVVIDGRELWNFRAARAGLSPAERASDTQASILHIAGDLRRRVEDVRAVHLDSESILLISRIYVFSVTADDARLEGKTREDLFSERQRITLDAIRRYREARAYKTLLRSVLAGLAALLAAVLCLVLLRYGYRSARVRLRALLGRSRAARQNSLWRAFQGPLRLLIRVSLRTVFLGLSLAVGLAAISFVLRLFPATAGISAAVVAGVYEAFARIGEGVVAYLPNLAVLLLVLLATRGLIWAARALARSLESGTVTIQRFHREWAEPTYELIRILLIMFGLVVAFPYLPGGDSPALKGASIFIGVLVSLGSGSAMGNVIAGVILTYMRPFRTGDRVKIADSVGDVIEKTLLITRIRTIKNVEVIVPNSAVLGAHIVNYSANAADRGLIVNTTVTIGYDAPWRKVHELLIAAALKTSYILPEPRPFVFQTSLNDFHVSYEINAFTAEANMMAAIYSELHRNIQEEFNAGGVEIMSPTYLSVRDGNTVTIPQAHRPADYVPPSFRVNTEAGGDPAR